MVSHFSSKSGKFCSQIKKKQRKTKTNLQDQKYLEQAPKQKTKKPENLRITNQNTETQHTHTHTHRHTHTHLSGKRQKKKLRILAAGFLSWMFFKVFAPASGKF